MKVILVKSCAEDLDVVNAARVSFAQQHEKMEKGDDKLIGFLLRKHHGTPFEHTYFRFHVEAPISVFREWHRHRIGHSYNEMSGRYVQLPKRFYKPEKFRIQVGKPGSYTYEEFNPASLWGKLKLWRLEKSMERQYDSAYNKYEKLLKAGIAKEQARQVLPVGIYSQMWWSCNARSMMHFLSLRNKPDAMKEIRDLAAQAEEYFLQIMPITAQAFIDNGRVAP